MKKIDISNYETLLFFLVRTCFLGICSNNLYYIARQNSCISIIIGMIIGIIPVLIYCYIIKNHPDKNIFEIIESLFGKILGTIINAILSIFVFLFATIIFFNLINFIGSQYLYKTPDLSIALIFGFCFFFLLRKGLKTISITSTIIFYIFVFLYILSAVGLFSQVNISNFFPFNEYGLGTIFNGGFNIIALNVSPIFLLTLIPYNNIENKEKFIKKSIIFYLIGVISILIIAFLTISILSPNFAVIMQYPEFHLLKRIKLIGFIERIENILTIQLILVMIMAITFSYYFVKVFLLKILKKVGKKKDFIIDLSIYIASVMLVTNIFKSSTAANDFYLRKFSILNTIFFIGLPFIIFIMTYIKKKNYTIN